MVGEDLQGHEEGGDEESPAVATAVAEHHAGDGGRDVGQRVELPDVTCTYYNKVIAGEGP